MFVEILSLDKSSIFLGFPTLSELPSAHCYGFAVLSWLLIGLNSFCLLVGLPFPYNPPKCFGLSSLSPLLTTKVPLGRRKPASNFSALALDLVECFKTPTNYFYGNNVDNLKARFFGKEKKTNPKTKPHLVLVLLSATQETTVLLSNKKVHSAELLSEPKPLCSCLEDT